MRRRGWRERLKSSRVRLEDVAHPDNVREAFLRAAKGKALSREVVYWREHYNECFTRLRRDILSGCVEHGNFHRFVIFEPKRREIHAPDFRERVFQHALCRVCEADFERKLIFDSYACRKGKGRNAALRRAERFAMGHAWFLKLDVSRYFDSIPHGVLLAGLEKMFRDRRVARLWRDVITSYETAPGRGLPIGALCSQHLANLYLAQVDVWVKQELRVRGYVRYMDDMVLFGDEKEGLKKAKMSIQRCLEELGLQLNPKWHLQPTRRGFDFLGYRVFPNGSCLNRASRVRFLRKYRDIEKGLAAGTLDDVDARSRSLSLLAFAVTGAKSRNMLKPILQGTIHWAPTVSIAAAAGTTTRRTAALPTATRTGRTTVTTISASASPSAPFGDTERTNRPG